MQLTIPGQMFIVICEVEHTRHIVHLLLVSDANGPLARVSQPAFHALATLDGAVRRVRPQSGTHGALQADTTAHRRRNDIRQLSASQLLAKLLSAGGLVDRGTVKRLHSYSSRTECKDGVNGHSYIK